MILHGRYTYHRISGHPVTISDDLHAFHDYINLAKWYMFNYS